MSKYLVIVESPTKAKTISKMLGKDYDVTSSKGHLVDLPKHSLSVKIEEGFQPQYKVIKGKEKLLKSLKDKAKGKKVVYIATDPDREGEAIGWHIQNKLQDALQKKKGRGRKKKEEKAIPPAEVLFYRVVFHEITEEAIKKSFAAPEQVDINKFNAQQARRILDRIVGYFLSPLLWKKIVRGLSAGRVQSVALKFIVEREKLVRAFVSVKSYGAEAFLSKDDSEFKAKLIRFQKEKAPFPEKDKAEQVLKYVSDKQFQVHALRSRVADKKPASPFTTSLLQQEAFNKHRFSSLKTMMLAQKLYEGIEIKDQMVGLITYMRTDSVFVSDKAKKEGKEYISKNFGTDFLPERDYVYKNKKGAQAAHEAIRPTSVWRTPDSVRDYLPQDEARLYELIWKRFVSSLMAKARYRSLKVEIRAGDAVFQADERRVLFEGFQKVTGREEEDLLPDLAEGSLVKVLKLEQTEHSTKPPARFTDASLVKLLEEKGIGRPSTYAPTIATLIRRDYMLREKGHFQPTDLGFQVCELLQEHFTEIMSEAFTAQIEKKLDEVEEGQISWKSILEEFYPPFKEKIDRAQEVVKKKVVYVDESCPQCGKPLVIKWSRRGRFLSCSGFPECKFAKSITTDVVCPGCAKGKLVERKNKKGQRFFGCSRFPDCTFTSRDLPKETEEKKQEA